MVTIPTALYVRPAALSWPFRNETKTCGKMTKEIDTESEGERSDKHHLLFLIYRE